MGKDGYRQAILCSISFINELLSEFKPSDSGVFYLPLVFVLFLDHPLRKWESQGDLPLVRRQWPFTCVGNCTWLFTLPFRLYDSSAIDGNADCVKEPLKSGRVAKFSYAILIGCFQEVGYLDFHWGKCQVSITHLICSQQSQSFSSNSVPLWRGTEQSQACLLLEMSSFL